MTVDAQVFHGVADVCECRLQPREPGGRLIELPFARLGFDGEAKGRESRRPHAERAAFEAVRFAKNRVWQFGIDGLLQFRQTIRDVRQEQLEDLRDDISAKRPKLGHDALIKDRIGSHGSVHADWWSNGYASSSDENACNIGKSDDPGAAKYVRLCAVCGSATNEQRVRADRWSL